MNREHETLEDKKNVIGWILSQYLFDTHVV